MNAWIIVPCVLTAIGCLGLAQCLCWANKSLQDELDRLNTYADPLEEQIIRHVQEKWSLNQENAKLEQTIRQLQRNIAELKHEVEQTPPF